MMRPLRRKGRSADVLWDKNVVLARRSQTRGDEGMEATKNATRFRVTFTQPGVYPYICVLHDELGMVGQVIVLP